MELIDEQHTSNNNWQCKHYIATLPLPGGGKGPRHQRLMSLGRGYVFFSFLFSLFFLIMKILDANTTTHYLVHYQPHINKSTTTERHRVVNTQHQHHYHQQINKSTTMGWRHVVNMWLPPTPETMNLRGLRCRIMDAPRARYVFFISFFNPLNVYILATCMEWQQMATTDNTTPTPAPGSLTGHPSVTQTRQHGAGSGEGGGRSWGQGYNHPYLLKTALDNG